MLRHPNIIAYYDSFTVDSLTDDASQTPTRSLMIVMEYADGGTLFDFIGRQKVNLPEDVHSLSRICHVSQSS